MATETVINEGFCGAWRSLIAECRASAGSATTAVGRALSEYAAHLEFEMIQEALSGPPADDLRDMMTDILDGSVEWPEPQPEPVQLRPPISTAVAIVLADGPLTPAAVHAAVQARGWAPTANDPLRYVAYVLKKNPDKFERTRSGRYKLRAATGLTAAQPQTN